MNRSFKVVFNKARGALMVVNEVTSSVQAKGTKTVVALAVATMVGSVGAQTLDADMAVTQNQTLTAGAAGSNQYASAHVGSSKTVNIDIAQGAVLTLNNDKTANTSTSDKLKGIYVLQGSTLNVNGQGKLNIDLDAPDNKFHSVMGVWLNQSSATINADTTIKVNQGETTEGFFKTYGVSVECDNDATKSVLTFNGDTNITVKGTKASMGARASGQKAEVTFNNLTMNVNDQAAANGIVAEYGGKITVKGDLVATVTTVGSIANGVSVDNYGNHSAQVVINGNANVTVESTGVGNFGAELMGFRVLKMPQTTTNSDLTVDGKSDVTVTAKDANVAGTAVLVNDANGSANLKGGLIAHVTTVDQNAQGIITGGGSVTVGGTNNLITANSDSGQAMGVLSNGKGKVSVQNVALSVESKNNMAGGLLALGGEITADNATIGVTGQSVAGVAVKGAGAKATLNGTNKVTATGKTLSYGLGVDGNGVLNVTGVTDVTAAEALIVTGAESAVNVNKTAEGAASALNLAGNVTNAGNVNVTGSTLDVKGTVKSTGAVKLADATLSVSAKEKADASTIANVATTGKSRLRFGAGTYALANLSGEDNTIVVTDLVNNGGVTVAKNTGALALGATGEANDQFANATEASEALRKVVTVEAGDKAGKLVLEEGKVNDALSATIDADGKLTDVQVQKNTTTDAFGSIATLSAFQWRHDMSDLTKRMGELRTSPEGVGAWARIYGSEQTYGAQNVKAKNHSVQVGVDTTVGSGWTVGAAFTYTDGRANYDRGDADLKAYGVAAYGTWMAENGQFVDLIAKMSRLSTDFDIAGAKGDFDNNAFSVSAEYGWHWKVTDAAFVEPQVELTYGRVSGEDVKVSNGVTFSQDKFESLIARAGLRSGVYLPDNMGVVYARASVLHDFKGEVGSTARLGKAVNTTTDDLGGTWVEFGLGANVNLSPTAYLYADVERTAGGEVNEDWRYNVGFRKVF